MVNVSVDILPSELIAFTVMSCDVSLSKSSWDASATVTTPVVPSIAKRPPALSINVYVIVLLVASSSCALAVIPTRSPFDAAYEMLFGSVFASVGVETS